MQSIATRRKLVFWAYGDFPLRALDLIHSVGTPDLLTTDLSGSL